MTAQSAARRASPSKTCRVNIVFRGLAWWPPLFFRHKIAEKITDYRDTAGLDVEVDLLSYDFRHQ